MFAWIVYRLSQMDLVFSDTPWINRETTTLWPMQMMNRFQFEVSSSSHCVRRSTTLPDFAGKSRWVVVSKTTDFIWLKGSATHQTLLWYCLKRLWKDFWFLQICVTIEISGCFALFEYKLCWESSGNLVVCEVRFFWHKISRDFRSFYTMFSFQNDILTAWSVWRCCCCLSFKYGRVWLKIRAWVFKMPTGGHKIESTRNYATFAPSPWIIEFRIGC